jgi:hypothetical protein
MRGSAWLAGRGEVRSDDLAVLRWVTTFRVPEEAHEKMHELLARVS